MKQANPALSADVFTVLKERIIRWDYLPAHRLTEEELCKEFGVSRSPVREALHMLVENGLVSKEPYRGYMVRQPDMKEIHDLYDVRQALELFAVEWLAGHGMPDVEWSALYSAWQGLQDNLPGFSANFAEYDEAFHEKLAECTGNQALVQTLRNIDERLHFVRMTDITTAGRLCATCEQHLRILGCIKAGDIPGARQAVMLNIEDGRQNVAQALKDALARSFQNLHQRRPEIAS